MNLSQNQHLHIEKFEQTASPNWFLSKHNCQQSLIESNNLPFFHLCFYSKSIDTSIVLRGFHQKWFTDGACRTPKVEGSPDGPCAPPGGAPLLGSRLPQQLGELEGNRSSRLRQHMAQNDFCHGGRNLYKIFGGSVKSEGLTKATVYVLSLLTWKLTSFSALKFFSAPQLTLNQLTDADLIA